MRPPRLRRAAARRRALRRASMALAAARVAIGVGIWLLPGTTIRILGFDPGAPGARALARLGGSRDVALGVLAAAALDRPSACRSIVLANALVDAGDAAALGIALARREGLGPGGALGGVSALVASGTGLWLSQQD